MSRDLYYFEYVERNADDVIAALTHPDASIFAAATQHAIGEADRFRTRLHVDLAGFEIGRDVEVEIGTPEDHGYGTWLPVSWRAASQAALFPQMSGYLEVSPLSLNPEHPLTQIGIRGEYDPPAGLLGDLGDGALGHRIAEAAIRNFVLDLAERLKAG